MSSITLPTTPRGYHLTNAFLSTFDLDENLLSELIKKDDINKYLIVRGDGEYIPFKEARNPLKDRIVDIFYEATKKKLSNNKFQPVKYYHAKIWFFIYENDEGNRVSKLVIQSRNIYPYDSIEVVLNFTGKRVKEKQEKNIPLVDYFNSIFPFMDEEKKNFVQSLIDEIEYQSFELDDKDNKADDFNFVTPNCKDIPLFNNEYDEILVIAPFINVETINSLLEKKKEGGRCVVLSQAKIIESLILNDVKGIQYLSPSITDKFVHSKIYLVRSGNSWDMYAGSMNLSDYSVSKNIEAMVVLKNIKNVTSIESFLTEFIGVDVKDELGQYSHNYENKEVSDVFNDAFKIETRIRYIKKLLMNKKYDEEYMNSVSSYLLSYRSVIDLNDIATYKKEIIPTREQVITGNSKKRYIYKLPFMEKTLLGLFNFALHKYDYLFSKNSYLHILDRSVDNAFIKLHETKGLKDFYFFRTDIHDYDPSINKEFLCSQIDRLLGFDIRLCEFLKSVVNESRFYLDGDSEIHSDDIAHQTGLPLGGFFENVYLYDFDFAMDKAPLYLRCGDDILIGSPNKNEIEEYSKKVIKMFNDRKLTNSENKTSIFAPGEKIFYLGWNICSGEIDFAESTLVSLQKTIKKKTKDLLIMYGKRRIPNVLRLPTVVRYVTHYQQSEFFVTCFRRITTTEGLKKIDKMIMDLIRSVVSGKTGNSKYKIKYDSIQAFGYKSLVNQYFEYIENEK